jgi:hypothetical protein
MTETQQQARAILDRLAFTLILQATKPPYNIMIPRENNVAIKTSAGYD